MSKFQYGKLSNEFDNVIVPQNRTLSERMLSGNMDSFFTTVSTVEKDADILLNAPKEREDLWRVKASLEDHLKKLAAIPELNDVANEALREVMSSDAKDIRSKHLDSIDALNTRIEHFTVEREVRIFMKNPDPKSLEITQKYEEDVKHVTESVIESRMRGSSHQINFDLMTQEQRKAQIPTYEMDDGGKIALVPPDLTRTQREQIDGMKHYAKLNPNFEDVLYRIKEDPHIKLDESHPLYSVHAERVKLHHERHSSSRDIAMQNLAEGPDHGIHLKDRAQKQGYDEHKHQSTASKALHKVKDVVTSPATNRIAGAAFLGSIMVSPTPIAAIGWAAFAYGVASDAQAKLKLDAKQEEYVLLNELHQANITAAKYKQKLYEKFPHEMDKYFGFEHNIVSYHDVAGSTKAEQKEQKNILKMQ